MYFGCIADDFTGAADAASFLQQGGMKVILLNDVPKESWRRLGIGDVDAAVIALKSRAEEPEQAVFESLKAAEWLKDAGVKTYYVKYCSTFDSTKKGNIGPVCDSLLKWSGQTFTVLCPSLPANGRTVKDGILYVNGVPLADSPMRFHPINPMKKSRIKDLMEMQSQYSCYETGKNFGSGFPDNGQNHFYLIPDYETEKDGDAIARRYGNLAVLTGGSGLCEALARHYTRTENGTGEYRESSSEKAQNGNSLILVGSCSEATKTQIEYYKKAGKTVCRMSPEELLKDRSALEVMKQKIKELQGNLLIYSVDLSENDSGSPGECQEEKSAVLDRTFGELAAWAIKCRIRKLVIAGGETSGAVTKKLGYRYFHIGRSIAPGVPLLVPENGDGMKLMLKSGNFGDEDFFIKALKEME